MKAIDKVSVSVYAEYMASQKKPVSRKVSKMNAPLSQRPYVTLAILVALVCVLALTIELIQDTQVRELNSRIQTTVHNLRK